VLRKIAHMITAILILISITGFTVNMHYCHGQLIDLAVMAPVHSCCDKAEIADTGSCHADGDLNKMNHCQNESILIGVTDDYIGTSFAFDFDHIQGLDLLFSTTVIYNIQGTDPVLRHEAPWYKEPPPFREVVLSQIQSYLI
jgi:hypothetical protein